MCVRECSNQFKVLPGAMENGKSDLVPQRLGASVLSCTENFKAVFMYLCTRKISSVLALGVVKCGMLRCGVILREEKLRHVCP